LLCVRPNTNNIQTVLQGIRIDYGCDSGIQLSIISK